MKISVFVGISVDGFLARRNDALDFLDAGGSEPHGYDEFIATVDTHLIGRRTFEVVLGFGEWPYGDKRVVVLSGTPVRGRNVERMSGEPAEIAVKLAASGAQHVYLDGGVTIQRFLRAGLVDRITVTRVPILIGEGIPLFGPVDHDISLKHLATHSYTGGLVKTEYEVVGRAILPSGGF
jgi:dihydrofolate reductase